MHNADEPAFPINSPDGMQSCLGLSKREYIAIAAMQGFLSGHNAIAMNDDNIILRYPKAYASFAFQMADAMIEQSKEL